MENPQFRDDAFVRLGSRRRVRNLVLTVSLAATGLGLPAIARAGCNPPVIGAAELGVDPVYARSWQMLSINYHDQCGAEQQTRVYFADAINGGGWQLLKVDGPDSVGWRQATEYGLDPGGRYCFEVEVDGNDGVTRRSQRFCTFTNSVTQYLYGEFYDEFYDRMLSWRGLDVVSSAAVSSSARWEALERVDMMVGGRLDLQRRLRDAAAYVIVIGVDEETLALPECQTAECVDRRGFGGVVGQPGSAVGEENLLDLPEDLYNEDVLVHEFGHAVRNLTAPAGLDAAIDACFQAAMLSGLWADTYAGSNSDEYWATATQAWFDAGTPDVFAGLSNGIDLRDELRDYDRCIYDLATYTYESDHVRSFLDPDDPSLDLQLWQYDSGRLAVTGGRSNGYYGAYVWERSGTSWVSTWTGWHYGAQGFAAALDARSFDEEFYVEAYYWVAGGYVSLMPAPGEEAANNPDRVRFGPAY